MGRTGVAFIYGPPAAWSDDMLTLNRSAIRVIAKQPLVDWLQSTDPGEPAMTLEEANDEPSIYLIPECEDDQEFAEQLNEVFPAIFEAELEGWDIDRDQWPQKRGFEIFCEWFDCQFHSMLVDLSEDPLDYSDL